MPSTTDKGKTKGIFGLFKGGSGCGKSVAALSFPGVYVFDFDKKMPAIANKHFLGKEIHYDTFKDIFAVAEKIKEFENYCPYETLFFDSLTALTKLTLTSIATVKGEAVVDRLRMNKKGTSIEMMSIDYYNGETNFIKLYWLDAIKALWSRAENPKHVLVSAHIVESESEPDLKTKIVTRTRTIVTAGKKVAAHIPTEFDEAYHFAHEQPDMGDVKPKHVVLTSNFGEDFAKTAYNFPRKMDFTDKSFYDILCQYTDFEDITEAISSGEIA